MFYPITILPLSSREEKQNWVTKCLYFLVPGMTFRWHVHKTFCSFICPQCSFSVILVANPVAEIFCNDFDQQMSNYLVSGPLYTPKTYWGHQWLFKIHLDSSINMCHIKNYNRDIFKMFINLTTMTRINLEKVMPSERSQTHIHTNIMWFHLLEVPRIVKFIETEKKMVVAKG